MKVTSVAAPANLMRLCTSNLGQIDPSLVASMPKYERIDLSPGIVQVGVGNFHRAHMAVYFDELFKKDEALSKEWAICGAGVTDYGHTQRRNKLEEQDYLYTVVDRDGDGSTANIVGSIVDCLPYAEDHAPLQDKLIEPSIKIVSMTVTEGGYYLTSDGVFDTDNEEIKYDAKNPDSPKTLFGVIVKALKMRKDKGLKPFAVMCCDNLPHNGDVVKGVVVGLAGLSDSDLAKWIEQNVAFPNGMVDRITPAVTPEDIQYIWDLGFEDQVPIMCEPFNQWVLEEFPGCPALDKVGVQFVPDVSPYETMKIRILNGGHASLCYPAALLGLDYVHDAMEHPVLGEFLDCLERNEIVPTVPPVPDTDLLDYWKIIQTRFTNPTVADRIDRNCASGSDRQPKFIVPTVKENLKAGRSVNGLATVCAMWCRYWQGTNEAGDKIDLEDALSDKLSKTSNKAKTDPAAWLAIKEVYGDTGENKDFQACFAEALKVVNEEGVEAAMKKYIEACKI